MSTLVRPQRDIGDGDEDGEISRVEKGGELIDYVITCDDIARGVRTSRLSPQAGNRGGTNSKQA